MFPKKPLYPIVFALSLVLGLVACGKVQPEILETSVMMNVPDTKGPYEVKAVLVGGAAPLKVSLVFSTDNWQTSKTTSMNAISDQIYQGSIPGQASGTSIDYYIRAEDSDNQVVTDPKELSNQPVGRTYRFRILP